MQPTKTRPVVNSLRFLVEVSTHPCYSPPQVLKSTTGLAARTV